MNVVRQKERSSLSASSSALVWGMVMMLASAGMAQTLARPVITPTVAPAAATPQVDAAMPDTDASRYVIGADYSLQITVWQEPSLSGTFPVRPDGMISLVLVGDIPAAGVTPMQLGINITERLKK